MCSRGGEIENSYFRDIKNFLGEGGGGINRGWIEKT